MHASWNQVLARGKQCLKLVSLGPAYRQANVLGTAQAAAKQVACCKQQGSSRVSGAAAERAADGM